MDNIDELLPFQHAFVVRMNTMLNKVSIAGRLEKMPRTLLMALLQEVAKP